jgi:chromosome partitioning protein
MRVVVVASQKGGSGKTTLAGHIAVQAERSGQGPVALIDTDPQGSLAKWWNVREAQTPLFIQSVFSNLFHDLDNARNQGIRLVVIDTPPAVTKCISEVVSFGDLIVVPTRPSPHDLRAVGPTVDIVEGRKKPLIFVVNAATARARITMEAAIALSQHGTVAPVTVHNRLDYAASMIDGRTVMEVDPAGKSAVEMLQLWHYLSDRLGRIETPQAGWFDDNAKAAKNVNALGRSVPAFGRRAYS